MATTGYCLVAGHRSLCLAHSHCRNLLRACRWTARYSIGITDWSQTEIIRLLNHDSIECRDYCFLGQEGFVPSGFLADRLADALHSFLRRGGSEIGSFPFYLALGCCGKDRLKTLSRPF